MCVTVNVLIKASISNNDLCDIMLMIIIFQIILEYYVYHARGSGGTPICEIGREFPHN